MNLESDIRSISYVKSNAADMLKHVNETHNPLVITQNREARGVLELTAAGERDIDAGCVADHKSTMASVRERLQAKRANRPS